MITYQCVVSGKVQGVFYRASVRKMAADAGFDGYVKNLSTGDVEACVSLKEEKILPHFLDILNTGSAHCKVTQIKTKKIDQTFSGGFFIKRI
jgi:acylphosphatase